jgi:glycosyltransferase involved in cell wall biosynthesis
MSGLVRRFAPATRVLQLEDAPLEDTFVEDAEGAARLRRELNLDSGPVAVYTGNFSSYQGVELLIEAAGRLAGRMPEARIVFVGGEPAEIERMRDRAHRVDAGEVCLFAGKRPTAEMRAFMTLADALLSPRTKGMNPPLKIYPYMLSGRVIVATDIPTHTQVVDAGCAVLVAPEADALAAGIERALRDREASARLARAAAARVQERFSLARFRAQVRELYEDLAAGQGAT